MEGDFKAANILMSICFSLVFLDGWARCLDRALDPYVQKKQYGASFGAVMTLGLVRLLLLMAFWAGMYRLRPDGSLLGQLVTFGAAWAWTDTCFYLVVRSLRRRPFFRPVAQDWDAEAIPILGIRFACLVILLFAVGIAQRMTFDGQEFADFISTMVGGVGAVVMGQICHHGDGWFKKRRKTTA